MAPGHGRSVGRFSQEEEVDDVLDLALAVLGAAVAWLGCSECWMLLQEGKSWRRMAWAAAMEEGRPREGLLLPWCSAKRRGWR